MDAQAINTLSSSLFYFVSVIAGLWVARRFVPPLAHLLQIDQLSDPGRLPVRLVLWLALGGLFAAPLHDLLAALESGLSLLFWPGEFIQTGLTPQPYFSLLVLLLLVVIYSLVVWTGLRVFQNLEKQNRLSHPLSGLDKIWLLLVPASLVFRLLRGLVVTIILLPAYDVGILNTLSHFGFFLLALAGLFAAAGLVAVLYLALKSEELKGQM
jgi:hypothetical protein